MLIKVFKNNIYERELRLEPDSYIIGRKDDCGIVLSGKNISRHHARLTIEKDSASIEDLSSSNGVAVGGKKIGKEKISNDQNVTIGDYELKICFEEELRKSGMESGFFPTIMLSAGNNPCQSSLLLLGIFFLVMVGTGIMVNGKYTKSVFTHQEIDRAILISKSLRDINSIAWQTNESSEFSLSDFEKLDGVVKIFLVDQLGRIHAPMDQLDKNITYPIFQKTLKSGKLIIEQQSENEYLICCPAVYTGSVKGAVLLLFKIRKPQSITDYNWILAWGALIFLAALVMFVAVLLVEIFLSPWKKFLMSASSAINGSEHKLPFIAGYKEIAEAKLLFERLLLSRNLGSASATEIYEKKENINTPLNSNDSKTSYYDTLNKDHETFFVIEEQHNTIIYCNPGFKKLFDMGNEQISNIFEIFTDHTILEAILLILQNNPEERIVLIGDASYSIHKEICENNPKHSLILFKKSNG